MIKIISKGYTSIQDKGRFGFRSKGIPYAGAMDQDSYDLCNQLLGNKENTPVIEYCKSGFVMEALKTFSFCIIGQVQGIQLNERKIRTGQFIYLEKGDFLDTGKVKGGTFAYLGIAGNCKNKSVLGSRSNSPFIMETAIEELKFDYGKINKKPTSTRLATKLQTESPALLDCKYGPEWDALLAEAKNILLHNTFHLSRETWRMAFKLQEKIPNTIPSISSVPVLPGTVQLTPSGEIVILMRDAQTTGGYPRILQLTEHAINKLCRVGWGSEIKFHV